MEKELKTTLKCLALVCLLAGCEKAGEEVAMEMPPQIEQSAALNKTDQNFKVPLPPGYHWEVSQSWGEHCDSCSKKYSDWNYCDLSHMGGCCKHSWDFNLPGPGDAGKAVLASADGVVKARSYNEGWGNYVLLEHEANICTRYAHMEDGSTKHLSVGDKVCQGLKLGRIGKTGSAEGEHLHFQFEDCTTGVTLDMAFSDGNGVPVCTRGQDVFGSDGKYNFLKLSNEPRDSCDKPDPPSIDAELPDGGWVSGQCGSLNGCPLRPGCDRSTTHQFSDWAKLSSVAGKTAAYLWSECALDGKSDGSFSPFDFITRAEALKISMFLFGVIDDCPGDKASWESLSGDNWYLPIVACAVLHGISDSLILAFDADKKISFSEAAKLAVMPALHAGVIELKNPSKGHFKNITKEHWAYPYAETLLAYGGIVGSPNLFWPDQTVERQEYAAMVAALSPCFCGNVICDNGCKCEQDEFACVEPGSSSGVGGEELPEEEPEEVPEEVPEEGSAEVDVSIECEVKDKWSECVGNEARLDVQCDITNHGDEELKLNNLKMQYNGGNLGCVISDADLQTGVGLQNIDPGETRSLDGHFEIVCGEAFTKSKIEVRFDIYHKYQGERIWAYDVGECSIFYEGLEHFCVPVVTEPVEEEEPDEPEEPPCVALTCEAAGLSCGLGDSGCGNLLHCGDCQDNYVCVDGQCKSSCTPWTCETAGIDCGVWNDGCGGEIYCGGCGFAFACIDGKCESSCTPGTCQSLAYQCGLHDDGCGGYLDCGVCAGGLLCSDSGKCYENCSPVSCESAGYQCNYHGDGCGGSINCGSCPYPESCNVFGKCSYEFDWVCESEYLVFLNSMGGSYKELNFLELFESTVHEGGLSKLHLQCKEFPMAILVYGGAQGIMIEVDSSLPPFAVWMDYEGEITLQPGVKPDMIGNFVSLPEPYSKLLLMIPPP